MYLHINIVIMFFQVVKLLVGNKVDQERVVNREMADEWAKSRGMLFMEASAKTKEGIAQVFNEVVQKVGLYVRSLCYDSCFDVLSLSSLS